MSRLLPGRRRMSGELAEAQLLTITVVHDAAAGMTVIDVAGELDLLTCPLLERRLSRELGDLDQPQAILNLSRVSFCGVAGLCGLQRAHEMAHRSNTWLHLVTNPMLDRLLQMTNLSTRSLACSAGTCVPSPPAPRTSCPPRHARHPARPSFRPNA